MTRSRFTESTVEDAALDWLADLGWSVAHSSEIASDMPNAERGDYGSVVLERQLRIEEAGKWQAI